MANITRTAKAGRTMRFGRSFVVFNKGKSAEFDEAFLPEAVAAGVVSENEDEDQGDEFDLILSSNAESITSKLSDASDETLAELASREAAGKKRKGVLAALKDEQETRAALVKKAEGENAGGTTPPTSGAGAEAPTS